MINYRGYLITPDDAFPNLYTVATEGRGGKIPNVLSGRFTTVSWIKQVIDLYVDAQVEKTRGKTNPTE